MPEDLRIFSSSLIHLTQESATRGFPKKDYLELGVQFQFQKGIEGKTL